MHKEGLDWIRKVWGEQRWIVVPLVVLTLLVAMVVVAAPLFMRRTFQGIQGLFSPAAFLGAVACLVVAGILRLVLYASLQSARSLVNHRMERDIRQKMFDRLLDLGPSFHGNHSMGDLLTRLTDDLQDMKLSWFLCSGIFRALEALSVLGLGILVCASIDLLLTGITAVPLILICIAFHRIAGSMQERFRRHQEAISGVNSGIETTFAAVRLVKAFAVEDERVASFRRAIEERRGAQWNVIRGEMAREAMHEYSWQLVSALVLLAGGWLIIEGRLGVPELVAFSAFSLTLTTPLFDIGKFFIHGRQAQVIIDRVRRIEDQPRDVEDPRHPVITGPLTGSLTTRDLGYTHPGGTRAVLSSLDLDLRPGEFVALTGRVGSGKSSLLTLLMRLADPSTGEVRRDGLVLTEVTLERARGGMGYVPQDPQAFSGSLADNVRFGRQGIPDERVLWALSVSQLDKDFVGTADLLSVDVGPRGNRLSGGQRQRLALARALAGMPELLLVDDGSASLDARTECDLIARLRSELPRTTLLWVSQRRSVLEAADRIHVLEEGRLVQSGTHAELLLASSGSYHDLHGH